MTRADDLGRVVIPKEIRRTMRIREGDPLEIYTDTDGEVIFKKYSPIGELSEFAAQYAEVLTKNVSSPVVICDRDHCIAAAGVSKKEVLERRVTPELEDSVDTHRLYALKQGDTRRIQPLEGVQYTAGIIAPIISSGDICGSVVFIAADEKYVPDESDITIAQIASGFLGKQMDE